MPVDSPNALTLDERSSKRRRLSTISFARVNRGATDLLTGHELQALESMNELISYGVRSFATGWLLEDTMMSLWYVDRMGAIQAAQFDIFKEPHYLLLVVAAMSSASLHDMGVCHLIKPKPDTDKFEGWNSMTLRLDKAETGTGTSLSGLDFELVDANKMRTDYGAVGRGTTIIPIRPIGTTAERLDMSGDEKLVAKVAWPPSDWAAEGEFVKKIRQHLRESRHVNVMKHIVDIKCSSNCTKEANLPRAFMNLPTLQCVEERVLRCLVMTKYEPLEMVNSVDEFKKIFIDVVRAHRRVYETSGILHRNISSGNVMFYRSNGEVMGVLCDWDLAYDTRNPPEGKQMSIRKPEASDKYTKGETEDKAQTATENDENAKKTKSDGDAKEPFGHRYRMGTGPFMAISLLKEGTAPLPIYRFDLESFFWLLAWFCEVFDPQEHRYVRSVYWEHPDLITIGEKKQTFLEDCDIYDSTYQDADAQFRDLNYTWVDPLRAFFWPILDHQTKVVRLKDSLMRARRSGKKEAEAQALRALDTAQQEGINLVTYEGFMELLGVKEDW